MKRVLSFLLSLAMLLSLTLGLSFSASAGTLPSSGTVGKIKYTFDAASGKLILRGSGALNVNDYGAPFYAREEIRCVEVSAGITAIGDYAFDNCANLESLYIADTVKTIGEEAFYATGLKSVTLPDSVTTLGSGAFMCCALEQVTLGGGLSAVPDLAFYGCQQLKSVAIPAGVTSVGDEAFADCEALTELNYSGSARQWSSIAFSGGNEMLNTITPAVNVTLPCTHYYDGGQVVTAATCTEEGESLYTCRYCGDSYRQATPITPHKIVTDKAIAATCTKTGLTQGSHCSACGAVLVAQEETPILPHKFRTAVTMPNCRRGGYTTYTCSVCRYSYKADYTDPAPHDFSDNAEVCRNGCLTYNPNYLAYIVPSVKSFDPEAKPTLRLKAKKKAAQLTWNAVDGAKSYEVQYSLKKNFKKAKTLTVSGETLFLRIRKLKSKKKYYFRIRAVSKSQTGAWSKTKKVKVK